MSGHDRKGNILAGTALAAALSLAACATHQTTTTDNPSNKNLPTSEQPQAEPLPSLFKPPVVTPIKKDTTKEDGKTPASLPAETGVEPDSLPAGADVDLDSLPLPFKPPFVSPIKERHSAAEVDDSNPGPA